MPQKLKGTLTCLAVRPDDVSAAVPLRRWSGVHHSAPADACEHLHPDEMQHRLTAIIDG